MLLLWIAALTRLSATRPWGEGMKLDRRGLLGLLGASATGGPAAAVTPSGLSTSAASFLHGVASGDPATDSVLLWTRATPATPDGKPLGVRWDVATDAAFARIVRQGHATADPARDYTVKVVAEGLKPGTEYHYRFRATDGRGKAVGQAVAGRTRTLPAGPTPEAVFAVASCALYPNGYFNAYRAMADLPRVDAMIHLGDYIYEYGARPGDYGMGSAVSALRPHDPPHELLSLDDYRRRHAQYKTDPDLQAAHARAPWIVVWDDHETANDSWAGGAENHQPGEGDWAVRKANALRAYYEWMPIREPAPGRTAEMAQRAFQFGDLATLLITETRLTARSEQLTYEADLPVVEGRPDIQAFQARWRDPERRLIGPEQHAWIGETLAASVKGGTAWQVIGNQVVMAKVAAPDFRAQMGPAAFDALVASLPNEAYRQGVARIAMLGAAGLPYNLDSWDGYPADRARLLTQFQQAGARPIVLAGDSHAFWANELYNDGDERVAVEFGATGVTSPGAGDIVNNASLGQAFAAANKEVVFSDQSAKGFVLLTLTPQTATAKLIAVSTILDRAFTTSALKTCTVRRRAGGGFDAMEVA